MWSNSRCRYGNTGKVWLSNLPEILTVSDRGFYSGSVAEVDPFVQHMQLLSFPPSLPFFSLFFIESRNRDERSNYQSNPLQFQELSVAFHLNEQYSTSGAARIRSFQTRPSKKEEESIFFLVTVSPPMSPPILTFVLTCSGLVFSHSPSLFMPT